MWLKRISILNYKNLEQVELAFSKKAELHYREERNGEDQPDGCGVLFVFFARARPIRLIRRIFYMKGISL